MICSRACIRSKAARCGLNRAATGGRFQIENPLLFYAKYWGGTAVKLMKYVRVYLRCKAMLDGALKAPDRWTYSDLAIAAPKADEFDALELYHATAGGEAALKRKYRDDAIRARGHAHDESAETIAAE